jgi:toxin ParE1/3/4
LRASGRPNRHRHDKTLVLLPRAKDDVDEIWEYTVKRWGEDQSETYIRQLFDRVDAVVRKPAIGRACPSVREGYFRYSAGSHVLFYRMIEGGIDVIRILHQRMDFEQHP